MDECGQDDFLRLFRTASVPETMKAIGQLNLQDRRLAMANTVNMELGLQVQASLHLILGGRIG